MTVRFRQGAIQDIEAMYELDMLCFSEPFVFTKSTFSYLMTKRDNISIVAETSAGALAGFVILEKYSSESTCLATLDVHPNSRRNGLGSHLLNRALHIALGKGLFKSHLQVYVGNESAIAFYLGFGYSIEGYLPDFYARGFDACLMSLEIQFPAELINEICDNQ